MDSENELFLEMAKVLESREGEIDIEDLLCAILRITTAVVSQAPDEMIRGELTNFVKNAYNIYLVNYLEASSKPITKEERKAADASEIFFAAQKGKSQ